MNEQRRPSRAAFTIIEVLAVITIAGLIAATVVPATDRIREASQTAGVYETSRMLSYARAYAAASGLPAGIRFNADTDTIQIVQYDGTDVNSPDPLENTPDPIALAAAFGADITAVAIPAAPSFGLTPDQSTVWFDHRGTPHARDRTTDERIELADDASVGFASGHILIIAHITGLIEVSP